MSSSSGLGRPAGSSARHRTRSEAKGDSARAGELARIEGFSPTRRRGPLFLSLKLERDRSDHLDRHLAEKGRAEGPPTGRGD